MGEEQPSGLTIGDAIDALAAAEYLRLEADFNRSWTDGRNGAAMTRSPGYVARRLEVAAERDRWADAIERFVAAVVGGGAGDQAEAAQPAPGAAVVTIPTFGFARGAVVRHAGSSRNMLVVRGLDETTACIVIESDTAGNVRLREFPTAELTQILPSGT